MYNPPHFEETRRDVMHDLIAAHPLGVLVTLGPAGLDANHIPFEISSDSHEGAFGTLRAHVARANPVWTDFSRVVDALVIFQGSQRYITPTWYTEAKPASGKVVPTGITASSMRPARSSCATITNGCAPKSSDS